MAHNFRLSGRPFRASDRALTQDQIENIERQPKDADGVPLIECRKCSRLLPLSCFSKGTGRFGQYHKCRECKSQASTKRWAPTSLVLTEAQKGYLAGLIDGEGWIGIVKAKSKKCYLGTAWAPAVSIGMTHDALLGVFKEYGLGYIYVSKRAAEVNWKSIISWKLSANCCRVLLPEITPFLRFKRRQAELLMKFLDMPKPPRGASQPQRQEYYERALAIWEELRLLNKRGV
jgi:hypothetical protein